MFGGTVLAIVVLVAVLAPWIAPYGEHERVGDVVRAARRSQHWLGLDDGGFDMLSLMMYGARVSLIVGFAAAVVAMLIGGTIGVLAGYFGGRSDTTLMRVTDYFLAIPDLPLMIVVAADLGPQPEQHHPDHRDHLLDDDRAGRARAGQEHPRARLHPAHPRARRLGHAPDPRATCCRRSRPCSSRPP